MIDNNNVQQVVLFSTTARRPLVTHTFSFSRTAAFSSSLFFLYRKNICKGTLCMMVFVECIYFVLYANLDSGSLSILIPYIFSPDRRIPPYFFCSHRNYGCSKRANPFSSTVVIEKFIFVSWWHSSADELYRQISKFTIMQVLSLSEMKNRGTNC